MFFTKTNIYIYIYLDIFNHISNLFSLYVDICKNKAKVYWREDECYDVPYVIVKNTHFYNSSVSKNEVLL